MASRDDAEAGWHIFREADYSLNLDEINERLIDQGFLPVAARTFRHYGKLYRYGYTRYVPINQLDVKTLEDPFLDQTARGREHPIQTATPIRLQVLDDGSPVEFDGQAIELSQSESVLRLRGRDSAEFFNRLGTTTPIGRLLFTDSGEIRFGKIDRLTLDVRRSVSTIRVDFSDPADLSAIYGTAADAGGAELRITLGTAGASPGLTEAARLLFWLSQAAEATRALVLDIEAQLESAPGIESSEAAPIRVRSLQSGSIVIIVGGGAVTLASLAKAFQWLLAARKDYWEGEKAKQEALELRWKNDSNGIYSRVDPRPLTRRVGRVLAKKHEEANTEMERRIAYQRGDTMANRQILPAAANVIESVNGEVEIEPTGSGASQLEAISTELEAEIESGEQVSN